MAAIVAPTGLVGAGLLDGSAWLELLSHSESAWSEQRSLAASSMGVEILGSSIWIWFN